MESASTRGVLPAPRLGPRRLLTEGHLARLAGRGDTRAFETIFERYHQELYRYCRAILGDSNDAQDALQNTMMAALRALPGESRQIALRPWLFRVAHNEAITITRRRADSPLALEPTLSTPSAESSLEERERLRELVADLNALPDRQRGALVMRELSVLSYREIATVLGTSEGAARQIVYEAREAIREANRGHEMECVAVREAISVRDGRVLRGRALRAHLRTCEPCQDFRAVIAQRRSDLQALSPPLPALATSGLLASLLGGAGKSGLTGGLGSAAAGSGGAGALAGGIAGGASVLTKGGALIAATVVATGAAGLSGAVNLPPVGADDASKEVSGPSQSSTTPGDAVGHGSSGAGADSGGRSGTGSAAGQQHQANGQRNGHANGQGEGHASGHHRGASATGQAGQHGQGTLAGGSDGATGPPEQANGNGPPASAGTGVGNAGGNSATARETSADPPRSASGAQHSNAGAGRPPEQANGNGNSTPSP